MRSLQKNIVENSILILFGIGSVLFFSVFYFNHLYQREQLQLFQLTFSYLLKHISVQGGFSIYTGEFLTQFFRVPVAGAIIITFLLIVLQQVVRRLFLITCGVYKVPLFSFLPSLIYFILMLRQFYYLSGLIGLIISVSAVILYLRQGEPRKRICTGILLIPVIYWLAGGAFIVFVSTVIIAELLMRFNNRPAKYAPIPCYVFVLFLLESIVIPLAARKFIIVDSILQSYLSEAYYAVIIFFPVPLIIIFASVPVLLAINGLVQARIRDARLPLFNLTVIVLTTVFFIGGMILFADFKEERRMAYENWLYDGKWDKIINAAVKDQPDDHLSLVAVNLALARTNQLTTKMFHFNQKKNSLFIDYERKGMTPFTTGEPLFHLGLFNFSQMFAMETIESTADAKLPVRSVRRAAVTYMLNGQYSIARKFLTMTENTLFYRKWSREKLKIINSDRPAGDIPELKSKTSLMLKHNFFYDYNSMDIALKYLLISNPDNRLASDYLLAYYLLEKDFDGFLQTVSLLKQKTNSDVPVVCQEAVAYILTLLPDPPEELKSMVTNRDVIDNFYSYVQAYSASRQDTLKMKERFGNTYWFYLHYK